MKFTMTKIAAALALTVAATGAQAAPTVMNITAGTFGMGAFTGGTSFPIALFDSTIDITDQYNLPGWDTTVAQTTGVMAPGAVLSSDQVNAFFALSAIGGSGGGLAPVFNDNLVNGNVSSIDMTSFFTNWGGTNFNQGNAAAPFTSLAAGAMAPVINLTMSNCVAGVTCGFTMSWKSFIVGGPFSGGRGMWGLAGTITAVPETSTTA